MSARQPTKSINTSQELNISERLKYIQSLEPGKKREEIGKIVKRNHELEEINSVLFKFLLSFRGLKG